MTALLLAVAGFVLGALLMVVLAMPNEEDVESTGSGIPGAPGQLQQPAQGSLQTGTNPQPPGSGGLQGGQPVTEQQARQLLQ